MKKRRLHLYTAAMLFACTYSLHGQTTYTDGVFMLNEDWYGHNNSTLNFIRPDHPTDPFEYYIIQNNESNAGQSLGATAQFGAIYGDYLFIISKQDQDAGDGLSPGESAETRQGGRIVVADAQTMEIKSRIPIIRANEKGVSIADGRSFVGVDETKGYVGTSNGIYILSFSPFEITGRIEGTENPLITGDEDNADGVGPLYQNQIGMMLRTADYVFAIQQDKGVLVIDPQTDKIIHTVEGCFSTMAQSKDGDIWVGRNTNMDYQHYPYGNMGSSGECWEGKELLRIDPETFETEAVPMTEGGINQTWYAWTAGSLCASTQENALYFTYNDNRWSWFTTSKLYRFDIDTRTFTQIYDSATDKRYFYGAGIRIHPLDDQIYGALYLDNVVQSYWIYQMDNQGQVLKELEPIDRYWFPALFIFPDNYAPEVEELPDVTLEDEAVEMRPGQQGHRQGQLGRGHREDRKVEQQRGRGGSPHPEPPAHPATESRRGGRPRHPFQLQRKIRGPYVARKIPHHRNPPYGRIPGTRMGQRRTHPHQGIATAHPRPHIRHGRTTDTQHGPVTGRLHRRVAGRQVLHPEI